MTSEIVKPVPKDPLDQREGRVGGERGTQTTCNQHDEMSERGRECVKANATVPAVRKSSLLRYCLAFSFLLN